MIIYGKAHPLKQRPDTFYFSAWRSVEALSRSVSKRYPVHVIHVNGEKIHADDYDRILQESDHVTVCGVPGDPGTALGVFLISLAISAALTGLTVGLTLLLRPKGPKSIGADTQTQSITGVGNQTDPFGAITKVYGNVRIYPKFPGKVQTQYTEIVGSDQFLRFLLLVCRGPVTITRQELKIGETSIENFQDVELNILEGRSTDPPLTIYTRDIREASLAIGLTQAADWQTQTTELNADEISVDWGFLRGLQHATKNGGRDPITVNVQIEFSKVGSGVWQGFDQAKIFNYIFLGAYPKQPLYGPVVVWSDSGDARTVTCTMLRSNGTTVAIPLVLSGTTKVVSSQVDLTKLISASASSADSNRLIRIGYYQQYDPLAEVNPGYSDLVQIGTLGSTFPTTGKTTSVVRRNHTWKPSVRGQYHVRMRRTTAAGDPTRDIDETTWTALRTIRYETPVLEPNCALIEGRIRATEQLNGSIENFSAQPKSWLRTFDGTTWTEPVLSDNPAWAVVDILTGYNENIPELSVPLTAINGPSFKAFADWCTANVFSFNYAFEETDNMEDAARLAAACGRGSLDEIDGEYVIVIDQPQTVIRQHFTPRNTWGFESSATYPDVVHALRVKFKNFFLNFQDDERVVYADGYSASNATIYELVEYRGITNPDQIYKFARYELAERLLIFEQMSFSVDLEQMMVSRGDLCHLSHDALLVGQGWGQVVAVELLGTQVSAITIDAQVFMLAGNTYGVSIRTTAANATIDAQVINEESPTVRRLRFVTPLTGTQPAVGDLVTFGEWGEIAQLVTIKDIRNIEDSGYRAARITVVPYIPGKYTADTELIPPHTPIISIIDTPLNLRPPTPTIRSIRSDQDAANIQDNGSYNAKISVLVDFEPDFKPAQVFIQAAARLWLDPAVDANPHQWINSPMEEGTNGELVINNVDVTLIYEVRVRSINKLNFSLISPWSATQTHAVLGDTLAPDPPTSVAGTPGDRSVTITWVNPTNDAGGTLIDFDAVEVWQSLINDRDEALYVGETAGESFIASDLTNNTHWYFWLHARDYAGNLSDAHTTQYAGLDVVPASNVVINKDAALLSSKTLNSLEDVLTLEFTTTGKKMQCTARIFVDDSVLNSGSGSDWTIEFRRDTTVIDTFTYPMARTGPGSPGMLVFTKQDQPAAGTYTYKIVYAGSTLAIEGRNLGIWVEEFQN